MYKNLNLKKLIFTAAFFLTLTGLGGAQSQSVFAQDACAWDAPLGEQGCPAGAVCIYDGGYLCKNTSALCSPACTGDTSQCSLESVKTSGFYPSDFNCSLPTCSAECAGTEDCVPALGGGYACRTPTIDPCDPTPCSNTQKCVLNNATSPISYICADLSTDENEGWPDGYSCINDNECENACVRLSASSFSGFCGIAPSGGTCDEDADCATKYSCVSTVNGGACVPESDIPGAETAAGAFCDASNPCTAPQVCNFSGVGNLRGTCGEPTFEAPARVLNPFGVETILASFKLSEEGAFQDFIAILYRIILPIAILLGLVQVALAGYGLMTSEGDPAKAQSAREQLTSAIMGLLFILLGVGILRTLIGTLIEGASIGIGL